ncbi:tRNA preQ1(34) S-adenosylmethionine ribosyltransferase-isomerase QueA [Taklimakanibacter albus]|uniref:tRNA preQ1(34) S-adenosylmethionine ribosyltransferase-isomerase QueA n=1 Tax=Taklimakanibacter albus TaxID=2800327 RepID=A0ACC5R2M9_9HYPH|nr:tRNA preQ1(34) S-adenosylmethionine ribosyltransferase-isomerase QueA [Aestuariivirga sp. YIM B02566]MBK1866906.1 tRNA preQ1(34) S-adenosylmethionine ribosyltransferase-isomerase QueA [Aestuariivirga sp. YIM B02566]
MRVSDFDFELPDERIALRPVNPRDAAKLLVVRPDRLDDRIFHELPSLLRPGDVLVFNKTKVIPAALTGNRIGRGEATPRIEALLHQRLDGSRWKAFAKPGKRLAVGDKIRFGAEGRVCLLGVLDATVEEKGEGGEITLAFDFHGPILDEAIAALGDMPLPPYIAGKRERDDQDRADYQTIYAEEEGAVAAPTAGLHFTSGLMKTLQEIGIKEEFITLHVGAGTFLPVKAEDTAEHRMHSEWGEVPADVVDRLKEAKAKGGRIIPVGTTSLRLLESAARSGELKPFRDTTDIFITPGYRFRVADLLITNFHLPRSTLFMLVSAFAGLERMKSAYAHAIQESYRFYSYGDASLLFPAPS